jgi:hypothetical protein
MKKMLRGGEDEATRLFGEITRLVNIKVEGKRYQVPDRLELLRCFQYLDFQIAYENFCWNASCENCATKILERGRRKKKTLCCQTPASEGLVVDELPSGIRIRNGGES